MNGIVIVNKPLNKTSHDIVYFMRRLTGIKKIGHTGTLDPNATGVLPMCIGKATKLADMLTATDKKYKATVMLGITTDTQDMDGAILETKDVNVTKEKIEKAIKSFVGEIEQIPPMYSAIKIGGRKLYELARKGIEVERSARGVNIYSIEIENINLEENTIIINVHCSKGTYIRTLCQDIGEKLGCGACMASLVRTQSAGFDIANSYTLEQLEELKQNNQLDTVVIPIDNILSSYQVLCVDDSVCEKIKNGMTVRIDGLEKDKRYRVYSNSGEFLSVSFAFTDDLLKLEKAFWQ